MILFKDELTELFQYKSPLKDSNDENPISLKERHKNTPLTLSNGIVIYLTISFIGILLSSTIRTYVFFGIITLMGLVAITETNETLKRIIVKSSKLLDLTIFGLTLFATISLGVTLAASLTFAGLGYTLIYAPYLRSK